LQRQKENPYKKGGSGLAPSWRSSYTEVCHCSFSILW
jgi:hypothetical protein